METKQYYEAYDDRYRQVHGSNLQWFSDSPSPIAGQVMERFGISTASSILELGCGEGRDAGFLLKQGFRITATDISPAAISYCAEKYPEYADAFRVLDCVTGEWDGKYDFIYAVAVIHMLVEDSHRDGFYRFLREHLREEGIALVCSMGDGTVERKSDISTAFELQNRTHGASGKTLQLAGTSFRMVNWDTFLREIEDGGLKVLEHGLTAVEPDFPVMMYAIITTSELVVCSAPRRVNTC